MAEGTESTPYTYPQGVPCWIETTQPDPEAARLFYEGLFGWTFENAMPPDAPAVYLVAQQDGKDAASISSDERARWITYIAVDDVQEITDSAIDSGAQLVAPVQDAGPGGRWSELRDPRGAVFRLWEARNRLGSQINNAPGSWNFSDLHTDDPEAAFAFYADVFGWELADMGEDADRIIRVPDYGAHLESTVDPGIRERQAGAPEGFADAIGAIAEVEANELPHWHVTFSVSDIALAVDAIDRLGGEVLERHHGKWSVSADVRDPWGAVFSVSQFTGL